MARFAIPPEPPRLPSDPLSSSGGGDIYFNTTLMRLRYWSGTEWITVEPGEGSSEPPASSGEVTTEKIAYDLPEIHPVPVDTNSAAVVLGGETQPDPVEDAGAGILFAVEEVSADPTNTDIAVVTGIDLAVLTNPDDIASIDTNALEVQPVPQESVTTAILNLDEIQVDPTETGTILATVYVAETSVDVTDLNSIAAVVNELMAAAVDTEEAVVRVRLWPTAVVTNTGTWANPNNLLVKTPPAFTVETPLLANESASLSVSSTGIGGITSNTVNGTLVVSVAYPNLGDLVISPTLAAQARFKTAYTASAGTALGGQARNMLYQISYNGGTNWTTMATKTTITADEVDQTFNVLPLGTELTNLRFRATGSITSGTGAVSTHTMTEYWDFVYLDFFASKSYT